MLKSDGDIIRGLGFVTLYSAYAEEQADALLERLSRIEAFDDPKRKWRISRKLPHALELLERLERQSGAQLPNLKKVLQDGPELFERRNELVHGRIYPGLHEGPDTLRSGRPNVPNQDIEAEQLYELANSFMNYQGALVGTDSIPLAHALSQYVPENASLLPNQQRP
jgi:hypothetical protein